MNIYPAIDLKQGKCVRLYQGNFENVTEYSECPTVVAKTFEEEGAKWLHIVDLDGASGKGNQLNIIEKVIKNTKLLIQVGGGIRSKEQIQALLNIGVQRVIIGSLAIKDPDLVQEWIKEYGPEKIVLALDIKILEDKQAYVAIHGWQELSDKTLISVIDSYLDSGLEQLLCTDINCDGTLKGPNFSLYKVLIKKYPSIKIQASGGVASLADLKKLNKIKVDACIVGKALYEKRFSLAEALSKEVQSC